MQAGRAAVAVVEHQRPRRRLAGSDLDARGIDAARLQVGQVGAPVVVIAEPAHQRDPVAEFRQRERDAGGAAAEAALGFDRPQQLRGPPRRGRHADLPGEGDGGVAGDQRIQLSHGGPRCVANRPPCRARRPRRCSAGCPRAMPHEGGAGWSSPIHGRWWAGSHKRMQTLVLTPAMMTRSVPCSWKSSARSVAKKAEKRRL